MKRIFGAALGLIVMVLPALAYDLVIVNKSKYDIHELYVSKSKSSKWGADQLRKQTIDAGEKFTLRDLSEGTYDLKVVDEDGTECVVEDEDVDQHKEWTITSKMLERCDKFN
jgi:hypothetical protein